ncbi:sugar transferase [Temperatibacter marinus]|uniref:Sugar transferase n=1 Tax=Temperatibacter marinus TaxID=1456591 RepID=A0AA52H9U4_9PROT|nr:sugar transferase [Temperatibacter marinus]WND03279.1 sugar transferase [Temperatibacter marinus]
MLNKNTISISEKCRRPSKNDPLPGWLKHNHFVKKEPDYTWLNIQKIMAALGLILLCPLWFILFIGVKATSKGPFIYSQLRPGLEGRSFTAYKIRTMKTGADKDKSRARTVEKDDPMITSIGKVLRDLKLDELPQLFNVMRGDMEFIGPRPIAQSLHDELSTKIPDFDKRLTVRPGLSSLAQISILHNADSQNVVNDWKDRFDAERHYIKLKSWQYDCVIMLMTALFIVKKIMNKISRKVLVALPILLLLLLSACGGYIHTKDFKKADTTFTKEIRAYGSRIDPTVAEIESVKVSVLTDDDRKPTYTLGKGDVLSINIFGEEGLSDMRAPVDGSGFIQVPYLESVQVADKTIAQVQQMLKAGYSKHFRNPWVVVTIEDYRSQPVYLLGQFKKPGVIYMTGPTNLMQILSLGQGLTDMAHLQGARLWRKGDIASVDLYALLINGNIENNIQLNPDDTIFIPSQKDNKTYVLGAVVRPGAVPFTNEPMTLLKALSQVGGQIEEKALMSQVRIIRTHSALEGQLILINANQVLRGKIPDLQLMPDDVIYVPDHPLESWNQFIRAITPTLTLAGGVLQPFVQIKFLKGD